MKRWLFGAAGLFGLGWFLRAWFCRLLGCPEERISSTTPNSGTVILSPVTVTGVGRATQNNELSVEVRNEANAVVGSGTASVTGPLGQRGPFTGTVTFTPGTLASPGFIQVFDTSPATGSVTHLGSVLIRF